MKTFRTILLAATILGIAVVSGCTSSVMTPVSVPKYNGGEQARMIDLTAADFAANPHLTREVTLVRPGSLIVSLEANGAADLAWTETAEISSAAVVQYSYVLTTPVTDPETTIAGPARSVWVFDSAAAGSSLVRLVYGQPGTDTARWTLTIYVTVS